ncbi:MAG: hypothetical protein A2312_02685 [Candidatus Staskawiczbacteria bacterium RIFOXYB2_FULL_32_9]|uniref:Excinuclease cho n=1 Tax=Candidatus Staskawiczbacteria bacterium RIFOXYD1_FULL_32_13 TaxID=1802234 RepID=A0A1G2JM30_9BACT|nr:MAG: Excinuclease ABC subunit C [Parcubacteria group bacterium GW2011_GWC2_32_10]OGZ80418.1 MAG: hypothetical protein A2256_02945 [Candidatus Staskawiczbacteria bacterium RIFOXYA2_FULL_32_7]OGZ80882.1 MAG: hypothetical protein A2360_04300 [Candidatus Staskawiczbacteria bacterium RIFOXYB1_FULL_32_11]OGZ84273.1 MAG: hypothetical protein A2312_02685 [Candidatus Staskawiczbacteria bacterium RIFOXYB2_FULL_32_9]OGZ85864.1 MAG: hypothetical protein A2463_03220 [Candidatus Staskawiczbacteria bacteri
MDKFKIISIKNIDNLPKTAGVYLFYNKNEIIYIGKAINIKNRVKNHFSSPTYKDEIFISQITNIGFIETGSEISALILEASLIKKNQPKFNQVWRDDKNYFYIAIQRNKQKIPYVFITHQPTSPSLRGRGEATDEAISTTRLPRRLRAPRNDKMQYIGPFVDGNALKKTIRFLRKVFPYYTNAKHSKLKCTYCHLDLCPGPQILSEVEGTQPLKEYKKNIKKLILILEGKSSKVLNLLKKEMRIASIKQNFEKASKIRDQIFALEKIISHKNQNNQIQNSQYDTTQRSLSTVAWKKTEKTLQEILNYKKSLLTGRQAIKKIECYDVSNIQGKFAVGSMVVFINGKPDKSQYKKFKIKIKSEPNDIAMLKEVLQRRFAHTYWKYPEIILIDGGKAQLNIAIKIRNQASEQFHRIVPIVISLAKGRQDPLRPRSEARLFIENQKEPIPLKNLPQEIYNLIKNLDDEAHRFAITYHKKLRKQNLLK